MSYSVATLLGTGAALAIDLFVLRTRLVTRGVFWVAYPIILFFQLVANGVLTGRGVVRYDPAAITGWRLAYAPVEDLLFGFALVLLSLSLWVWWGRRGVQPTPRAGDRPHIRPAAPTSAPPPPARPAAPASPASPPIKGKGTRFDL